MHAHPKSQWILCVLKDILKMKSKLDLIMGNKVLKGPRSTLQALSMLN